MYYNQFKSLNFVKFLPRNLMIFKYISNMCNADSVVLPVYFMIVCNIFLRSNVDYEKYADAILYIKTHFKIII